MDATQMINDSILESDEEENEEENKDKRGQPLAKLCILNNEHIPAAELPLFLGDNVLGRDPNTCTLLLPAPSVSKQHATICISAYERRGCRSEVDVEALIWDLGSMNGTRKGRLKLTPNVRYALEEGNSLVVADIPCQYVSCAVETVPSQGDMRTPMSRNSDVKTRLLDASNKKGGDTSAGSKKCVNGGTKPSAMVSSLDLEDTRKTPARITCLSFEQTPTQPHGTLVPESDSDSDGEGRRKPLVLQCDSDSHKSSPTCSTFLSPTNKIVPESEDESPITPASSTKNRPYRHVSLSKEEPDIDAGRQQLKKKEKLGLVDNSEEEEEEERATPGGMTLEKSGQDVPAKQESNVNVTKEEELPVSTRVFPTDLIPVFNMDSDTDMEEEDENVASAAPVTLNTNQQVDQPPNTVQFHMDSDTDVDEGDDTFDKDPKCVFFSDNDTKPPHALPVIQPEGITMDSDTDMEEDDENVVSAAPVTLNTNQQVDQPPNIVQFHMDSDTDVDEGDDTFDKGPKCVFFSDNDTKPPHALPVIQPEGITMDSDTDVDDDADMSEAAAKAKPTVFLSAHTADSAPSSQPKDFHLDSDTDVDEEEQNGCGTNSTCSKINEALTRIDVKPTGPESVPAARNSLHLDSDTDDEVISAPAVNEAPVVSAVTDSCTSADAGADNSDTDVEEDSPLVIPVAVTTLSVTPGITLAAAPSDSDADRDVDESSIPPGGDGDNPADLRPDSDRDVEDKDAELGEIGEDQILSPCREITSKLPVPLLQNRSAPVQFSEGEVEDMETQAFLSPSLDPIRRAVAPAVRPVALSSCSDGQEDEDFVVAETQSFILQTRNDHAMDPTQAFVLESSGDEGDGQSSSGGSFQLGLSDSSHLQCQAQALAEESTQAFVSVGRGVNLEDIRAYAAISTADRTSVGNDLNLEATQAYGGDEEPARSPVTFEKEGQGDLALEATQAYITEPCSDSEDETEEDERKNPITADFPTSSAFAMAETQPVCVFREEESLATESHTSNKTDAIEEHVEVDQPEERPLRGALSIVETMCTSDDEDSILGQRRRKAKQLKEESQSISSSENFSVETQPMHVGVDETQPVATSGNEENDDEDSSPFPQKRKAKQLRLEEEGTETETLSAAETQPMNTCEDKESDDEDSIPGPRKKRKAKQLEEESQPISSSENFSVETQPMHVGVDETQPVATSGNEENDDEDSSPFPQKRKAKQLRLEEEGTETETLSAAETQPMNTCEDKESDDEDSIPGPRKKRKAKQLEEESQPISSSENFSVETQPMHVGVDETQPVATSGNEENDDEDSSPFPQKRKAKQLRLEEEGTETETLSAAETQPMNTCEDKESDDEDSIPGPRKKRKAKQLEEESQPISSSENFSVETQPMHVGVDETQPVATSGNEENDDEDSSPFPQKRKAKQLRLEEEGTETETLSAAETQPMNTCEDKESDDEDSIPGPRKKGKAKPLQFEDEQTQSLTSSVVPSDEIEAVVTGEDMENDEELIVGQRKRKAKPLQLEEEETQSLTNSEASTVESQAVRTNTGPQPHREKGRPSEATTSGISVRSKRATRARLREEEESSEPPRRQTRGNKAFSNSRGRKQKSRLDESDEEEVVEQVKQARGRKSTRHRKDDGEEKDRLEIERNKQEQQEGMLGEEKDVTELRQREIEETEKERMKIDEKERLDMEKRELEETERQQRREEQERKERKRKDKEEQERLQAEKAERLRLEQEGAEKERIERERWEEKEEKERADRIQEQQLGRKEMIEKAKQEEKERLEKEENERIERERKEQEDDVVLVRKTRSRSNSVSSEKSAASVNIQGSRGRGRGRGAKRTTEPAQTTISRGNNRRATVAAQPFRQSQITEQDSNDFSPQGILSRSNSSNSLNSEISISSSCISSQNRGRGRGGRQRGRGRTTESDNTPPISSQSDQSSTPKPTARGRGRKSRKTEVSSNEVSHEDDKEKADSQQACATRGQKRANVNDPEPKDADEEGCVSEHSLLAKRNVRGRGQKAVKSAHDDEDEANEKRKGEKELKANAEGAQTAEAAREEAKDATTQAKRRGRASSSQGSKNTKEPPHEVEVKDESEKMEEVMVERRARGRPSVVQKKKKEVQEESGTCVSSINQDANMTSEPQTPNSSASRKRQAPTDSSPVAKTPRSASASPAAGGRLRAVSQAYKVLFTGVVDEAGERVLARLGGSMAKGVTDMNCLVTDKVRRTVKFLCAVAKGVPIVTTHWLEKSGKAGSFLSPNAFAVNDPEQEKKFNFCLQESLKVASSQPLLQGYEIHVTKSVKPEPVQMKDIISCSGATFLSKMPSFHKPQTVVISCEEDWSLCGPAVSASLPIVTAEFILTGILQQKFDTQTHKLPESTANLQPAGGRGRGRKKT
ncbi:hypothetical protein PAMA_015338 [Pampus argenteus]